MPNLTIGPAVNKDPAGTPGERLFGRTQALVTALGRFIHATFRCEGVFCSAGIIAVVTER